MSATEYSDEDLMRSHYYDEEEHRNFLEGNTMILDKEKPYNPWKSFILDVIDGNTSFSTQDYDDIIQYIDKLVEDNDKYKQELTETKALAEMWYLIAIENETKLKLANKQTEHFEREWYLCCDKLDSFSGEV